MEEKKMIHNALTTQADPEGYKLPKAAVNLITTAALAQWTTGWQWGVDSGDHLFVKVHMLDPDSTEYLIYTWHSRGTGTLRLSSKLLRKRTGAPWGEGPSLKGAVFRIREVADQRS
ncbi:hypothetical protein [Streptomyces sp. NPDC088554]|uniref:hypothetical protein n=1 Tax=Streptomyces sp. NPDC088554 TaxID=3365865 RepID=UPI00380BD0BD